MRNLAAKFVLPLGIVIALAILEGGPRAEGAYLSVASAPALQNNMAMADDQDSSGPVRKFEILIDRHILLPQAPNGSSTSSSSNGSSGDGPPVGLAVVPEKMSPDLESYLRESPDSLILSHFVASILDPPRAI